MKKTAALFLAVLLLLSCAACGSTEAQAATVHTTKAAETTAATTAAATEAATEASKPAVQEVAVQETLSKDDVPVHVTSKDGLVELDLPNQRWAELHSDEHTLLFSDGDCAIAIDLYKTTDTLPSIPLSDETHKLIFTSTVSVNGYVLFITGYAHEEEDFSPIGTAIKSIQVDKTKVPEAVEPEDTHDYTVQDANYSAWVTATALNVRSASGTDATVIASLPKSTKVTVIGEVLEDGRYIGWSKIKMSNGTVGFVASQFLSTSQPKAEPQRTGNTKTLWSERGTAYTLYEYSDGSWKNGDGTTFWPNTFSTWINSAGKTLYDYDPSAPVEPEKPTKTGTSTQLWDSTGIDVTVYFYSDNVWRADSGATFWPDGFSTWGCDNGRTYYDYDPTYVEPTDPQPITPADDWKETFEKSLYGHDGMIACWYTYLGDGIYEVYCQDPDNADKNGTVQVNAYTGSWNWV